MVKDTVKFPNWEKYYFYLIKSKMPHKSKAFLYKVYIPISAPSPLGRAGVRTKKAHSTLRQYD